MWHFLHANNISCHSQIELFTKKGLLRVFYEGIPVAEVMCIGRMDMRKLSEDVVTT
jgi:hypothetical protein